MPRYNRLLKRNRITKCSVCGGNVRQVRSGEFVCVECGNTDLDDFGKVRQYLNENGPQTKEKIILETGVTRDVVNAFLEEQRLEVAPLSAKKLNCLVCGKEISSGTICSFCLRRTDGGMQGHAVNTDKGSEGKMRYM
ncbi:MAG: hypothetical protein K5888_00740 [Lachnospiraceae bacterium]|nr:hypothetical protein [Lachnospiraceae bacterium]